MYKNCSEIPIFNFFEVIKTKDFSLLLKEGEDIKDFKEEDLFEVLLNIMVEYNALTENKKLMQEYTQRLDIEYMEAKYNLTKELISMYHECGDPEVLTVLKGFNWSIDLSKELKPQLDRILRNLVGLKNQIGIKKANFVKRFKKDTKEQNPNFDLERAIVHLETGIPLSYKIDVYKDSIKRYVYWVKILEQKNKAIENGKTKPRR